MDSSHNAPMKSLANSMSLTQCYQAKQNVGILVDCCNYCHEAQQYYPVTVPCSTMLFVDGG